jgi:hypothetical protein
LNLPRTDILARDNSNSNRANRDFALERENTLAQRKGLTNFEQGMTNVHVAEYKTSPMDIPCSTLVI